MKKQKEDDFKYGGERSSLQVLSNSFIPTLICLYVSVARSGISSQLYDRVQMEEGKYCVQECNVDFILLPTVLAYYCECCADTWGSEVGILSSTPFLLFLPWRPVPVGTNGGVSSLGLSTACLAGLVLTLLYVLIQPSSSVVLIIFL